MVDREADTLPPPNTPESLGALVSDALLVIADDLDKTRDIAVNGNLEIIKSIGALKETVAAGQAETHAGLAMILQKLEQRDADFETHKRATAGQIQDLRRKLSNGHAPT